jgi:TolB protein
MKKPLQEFSPTPSSSFSVRRTLIAALAASPVLPVLAQFRVEVSGVGLTQLPIAVAPFRGEADIAAKSWPRSSRPTSSAAASSAASTAAAGQALDETSPSRT